MRGFSLIELLIVVAIFGVLVVVVFFSNPLEQIRKAKDAAVISVVEQTNTAFQRSEVFNQYPLSESYTGVQLASKEGQQILNTLETTHEINSSFSEKKQMSDIYLTFDKEQNKLSLCFKLESIAFRNSFDLTYSSDGQKQENCSTGTCFACLFDEEEKQIATNTTANEPQSGTWIKADSTNNCNEFCASKSLSCTDNPSSCPIYCGSTSGYAQIEATWATWYSSVRDPATNQTCWGSGNCSTEFRWRPLWAYNARCCCE